MELVPVKWVLVRRRPAMRMRMGTEGSPAALNHSLAQLDDIRTKAEEKITGACVSLSSTTLYRNDIMLA